MHVFLIASVPLAYVYLLVLREQTGRTSAMTAVPALKGALAYLILLVPLLLMRRFVARPYDGAGLYLYASVYDYVLPVLLLFALYLRFTRDVGGLTADERFLSLVSFYAGAFALAGVLDLFLRADYHGPYELFMLPALRIGVMLILPSLYYQFSTETFWVRYLYLGLIAALPWVTGFVPLLSAMYLGLFAALLTGLLFFGGLAVAYLASGGPNRYRLG